MVNKKDDIVFRMAFTPKDPAVINSTQHFNVKTKTKIDFVFRAKQLLMELLEILDAQLGVINVQWRRMMSKSK